MRRCGLLVLLLAAVALAATLKFKHLLDPLHKKFPLTAYTWEDWEKLDKATRLRARGTDPAEWQDPPPDPEAEEEKRKEKEEEEADKNAQRPKNYPKDRAPGFRFDDRLEKKKAAFETLVQPAAASKLEGIVKQLRLLDKALEKYERKMEDVREEYAQLHKQLAKVQQVYIDNYKKKYGKYPKSIMVPVPLLVSFNKASRTLQRAVALEQSEHQFHEWLLDRTAELIAELSEEERTKPVAALAKGIKAKDWRMRTRSAALLGRLDDARSVAVFMAALGKETDPLVLAELIRIRVRRGGEGVFDLLKQRIDDPNWPVRAAVVQELAKIPRKESIDLLVARMEKETGRLLDDIALALRKLTGEDFVPEPAPWKIWWKKSRETWKPPKEGIAPGKETGKKVDGVVYFYGIRSTSTRVVFCIDISGSMDFPLDGREGKKPPRIETAKRELNQALIALPEEALFNIVVYSANVRVWKKNMKKATLKSKQAARKFVDKLQPVGATNIYDALMTSIDVALKAGRGKEKNPEADTIFFLTDGKPTHGRIVNPHQILEEITKRNKLVGLVIHTVGVSKEQNAGFLLNLAKRNGGRYVAHK